MKTAIINIGRIVSGDWRNPFVEGDALSMEGGRIVRVGSVSDQELAQCDVVIDAAGSTAVPGLIDSQVHNTFGDYTPRQKTVGFLESYVHGGVTTAISASEVHVPGRPKDPSGVKALAVAAMKCFEHFRPGGMRVWAGAVILEPGLEEEDFADIARQGVWLAKAGFGAVKTPYDYAPMIASARKHGMTTLVHTGGSSIPGSSGIWADHLIRMNPHVSFHTNGGPVAMPDEDYSRLVHESQIALQFLIATDTPTGSGIMPLGMMYTITHLASLGGVPPEMAIAAATGNNARVYSRNSGFLAPGRDADVVLIDACVGGSKNDALSAIVNSDIAAVAAVVTDGVPRFVGRSRNTPASMKTVRVAQNRVLQDLGALLRNRHATGSFAASLQETVQQSAALGQEFGRRLKALLGGEKVQSYGKACVVGMAGEYEHGNALLTDVFANPVREAVGGGKSWIPSTGKRGGAGSVIDIPLAHKDALYVRSHYDTATVAIPDGPAPDEVLILFAVATRGRLGGLAAQDVKGLDGLR